MTLDQKIKILRSSKDLITRYIFERTVVIAVHDDKRITDHGTGMLLKIEDQPIIITAAHVIKDTDPDTIQIITTEEPSNVRFSPAEGDCFGNASTELDVGFLRIKPSSPLLSESRFLSIDDLEFFPTGLTTDLAIVFGMPEAAHKEPSRLVDSFASFTYMTSFPEDLDWSVPGNRPATISVDYDESVQDAFTGRQMTLPAPFGMSGGGLWRARFDSTPIWTPDCLRLVGILTEFYEERRSIKANRVENLYHLLSQHFALPEMQSQTCT